MAERAGSEENFNFYLKSISCGFTGQHLTTAVNTCQPKTFTCESFHRDPTRKSLSHVKDPVPWDKAQNTSQRLQMSHLKCTVETDPSSLALCMLMPTSAVVTCGIALYIDG